MAVRKVGARVELDGEREYKAALSELNSGNRVLASEMKKLKAEFKGNEESTEALTKKGELLERQLLQQKDKVETLKNALASAAQQYGEADSRTQAWAVRLNNAEAAQYDLEHAIEENNAALQESQDQLKAEDTSLVSVGDTVDDLTGKFGIRLPEGLKTSLNSMQGFSSGTVLAMSSAAAGVTALIKIVSELHEITKKTAADVDEILTESMTTGLSTRTIQELKYAENLIDVSYSTITSSMTKLVSNMDKARDGNEATAASFAALGVAITDETGQLRDAESVFYEVIDALGAIENPTERDAVAMDLLGKSAQDLNPLIIQGSEALKDYAAQAEATGYILDESQLKKLGEVDDAYQELQLQLEATQKQMASELAPTSKEVMETFSEWVKKGGETLSNSGILSGLGECVKSSLELIDSLGELISVFVPLDDSLSVLKVSLYGVAYLMAAIADTADAVKSILTLDWTGFKYSLGFGYSSGYANNTQRVTMSYNGDLAAYDEFYGGRQYYEGNSAGSPFVANGLGSLFYGSNASGNQNWRGGLTYLSENGAETAILPSGTKILSAQDTRALGGDTFIITIDTKNVQEFNDIVEIAKSARVIRRKK